MPKFFFAGGGEECSRCFKNHDPNTPCVLGKMLIRRQPAWPVRPRLYRYASSGNSLGYTPLMGASRKGHTEIVRLLLADRRTDPNVQNRNGWTALMNASADGY